MKDIIEMAREIADSEKVDPWDEQCGLCVLTRAEIERLAAAIRAAEREACAKVCDDIDTDHEGYVLPTWCSRAIRARSNT